MRTTELLAPGTSIGGCRRLAVHKGHLADLHRFVTTFSFDAGSRQNAKTLIGWIGGDGLPVALAKAIREKLGDDAIEVDRCGRFNCAFRIGTATLDAERPEHLFVSVNDAQVPALVSVLEYARSTLKSVQAPIGLDWADLLERLTIKALLGGSVARACARPSNERTDPRGALQILPRLPGL